MEQNRVEERRDMQDTKGKVHDARSCDDTQQGKRRGVALYKMRDIHRWHGGARDGTVVE